MKKLFDWVMRRRAASLTARLRGVLEQSRRVADIGSGSGHNARCWRATVGIEVDEFDVANLNWVGEGPTLWDGARLPSVSAAYDAATLLFVLQYSADPINLLQEVRRICSGRVLVVQATYRGTPGKLCLALREFCWGRLAFHAARLARVIRSQPCPLVPRRYFTREALRRTFDRAGFRVLSWEPEEWPGLNISRDLFVLEATCPIPTSRSSSRLETKSAG